MASRVASQQGFVWSQTGIYMGSGIPVPVESMLPYQNPHYQPPLDLSTYHHQSQMIQPMALMYQESSGQVQYTVPYQSDSYGFAPTALPSYHSQPQDAPHFQQVHESRIMPSTPIFDDGLTARTAPAVTQVRHSPLIQAEELSPVEQTLHRHAPQRTIAKLSLDTTSGDDATLFYTAVDCLMRVMQAREPRKAAKVIKAKAGAPARRSYATGPLFSTTHSSGRSRERYNCTIANRCETIYQKTHLEDHVRTRTASKPFLCQEPGCGQHFSQLANLKTHERRHTGERPYSCDICGKTFAQKGNVRAHNIVHQQIKPFTCILDDCGKNFTQLGNLKSHQNKFHNATLHDLTTKFASLQAAELSSQHDKDLWNYFSSLYKNTNKGIKGRGKDRKIYPKTPPHRSLPSPTVSASVLSTIVSRTSMSMSTSPPIMTSMSMHGPAAVLCARPAPYGDRGTQSFPLNSQLAMHTHAPQMAVPQQDQQRISPPRPDGLH